MRFRDWLAVGTVALLGYLGLNCKTEIKQLYNGPMPQGHVVIEKVDRRPLRKDDRLTEIVENNGRTILFKNHNPGNGLFLDDDKDYIKVRYHDGSNLIKKVYWQEHAEDPEAQELSQLFWDVSRQYGKIRLEEIEQEKEAEYRRNKK